MTGLIQVLQYPYFLSAEEILLLICDTSNQITNGNNHVLKQKIDDFDWNGTNVKKWKETLENCNASGTYIKMSSKKKKDGYEDSSVSELVRLIRNQHEHAEQNKKSKKVLFPGTDGYWDKTAFVQFWVKWFPELIPGIWAIIKNKDILNHTAENPTVENHTVENPTVENHTVEKPTVENHTVENHTVENPTVENHTVENHTVENPTVENHTVENINDRFKDLLVRALKDELNKGCVSRYKIILHGNESELWIIQIDPTTYQQLCGIKLIFITEEKLDIKQHRIEVRTPGKQEPITYELKSLDESISVLIGVSPLSLGKHLITKRIVMLVDTFNDSTLDRVLNPEPMPIMWKEIYPEVQNRLINNAKFLIRSKSKGKHLLFDNLGFGLLEGNQLTTLLKGKPLTIFENKSNSEGNLTNLSWRWLQIESVPIENSLAFFSNRRYLIVNVREQDVTTIENIIGRTKMQFYKPVVWEALVKNWKDDPTSKNIEFEELLESKTCLSVKYVQCYDDALAFINAHAGVNKFNLFYCDRQEENRLKTLQREDDFLRSAVDSKSLQIISGVPGNGKTTLLAEWCRKFSVLVTDSESIPIFTTAKDLLSKYRADDLDKKAANAIMRTISTTKFEEKLAGRLLGSRHFTLFVDAVDEIADTSRKTIIELLNACESEKNISVIATCRPHWLNEEPGQIPPWQHFVLQHVTFAHLQSIIVETWKSSRQKRKLGPDSNGSPPEAPGSNEEAEKLLDRYRNKLLYKKRFKYTPLFTKMIAEIHKVRTGEVTETSLSDVYDRYVTMNFECWAKDKLIDKEHLDQSRISYKDAHMYLAIQELVSYKMLDADSEKFVETKLTKGQGLLLNIDPPRFIHQSFAEYFVDLWCMKKIKDKNKNKLSHEEEQIIKRRSGFSQLSKRCCYFLDELLKREKPDVSDISDGDLKRKLEELVGVDDSKKPKIEDLSTSLENLNL